MARRAPGRPACPRGGTATSTATARGSRARASSWVVVGTVSRSTIWGRQGTTTRSAAPGGLQRGRFRPRRRIENNGGHAPCASRIDGWPEPCRRGVADALAAVLIEGIASAFDRAEARRRREAALYRIRGRLARTRRRPSPTPRPGKRNRRLSDSADAHAPKMPEPRGGRWQRTSSGGCRDGRRDDHDSQHRLRSLRDARRRLQLPRQMAERTGVSVATR